MGAIFKSNFTTMRSFKLFALALPLLTTNSFAVLIRNDSSKIVYIGILNPLTVVDGLIAMRFR